MSTRIAVLWAIALSAALSGCSEASKSASCAVTLPVGTAAPEQPNYGNNSLRVVLWPRGRLVAGQLPDGSSYAEINPDGSIEAKLGWWRTVAGRLSVEGERLDAQVAPLGADIPDGYGDTGFQPAGLVFPTAGCWRVVGSVVEARLAFVVLVTKH